ncbi:MAG: 30S ribosomal protein S9 [Chloroflexi bacterium]|nr:30S ribosomal protein S9 [Chloroflexota bacterium]MQC26500.1 30S ribosomal protein S9 [Chloroflexota bacterium]
MAETYYEGIGRRKSSTARVRVTPGTGLFTVNDKPLEEYFPRMGDTEAIFVPLDETATKSSVDVSVHVRGGGPTGQTGAVVMGLARALSKMNPDWHPVMAKGGLLRRDSRMKERKKPGLKRARKAPTYTKR